MTDNHIADAQAQLDRIIRQAYAAAFPEKELRDFVIEIPKDTSHGDFATNVAMVNTKNVGRAPRDIAAALIEAMDFSGSFFTGAESAGPGFINFRLGQRWFSEAVQAVLDCGRDYGRSDVGGGKKVMVEFVSANPTGPMHMGKRPGAAPSATAWRLRWTLPGMRSPGSSTSTTPATRSPNSARALRPATLQLFLGEEAVEFPEDGYHGEDIKTRAREFADLHGDRYVNAPSEERLQALIAYALPANVEGLRRDLEKYRHHLRLCGSPSRACTTAAP